VVQIEAKDMARDSSPFVHFLQNTLLYTQLINFESNECHSATAKTIQDAQKLVEAGFEYVYEFNGHKIFRKKKC